MKLLQVKAFILVECRKTMKLTGIITTYHLSFRNVGCKRDNAGAVRRRDEEDRLQCLHLGPGSERSGSDDSIEEDGVVLDQELDQVLDLQLG